MTTLLEYVRDNRVVGTQSTGNMPLKAIREVTACFVDPPALESTIGSRTYKIRSEDDVWELQFLHILAEVGGLLTTGRARRWRLADAGHTFLDTPSLFQVSFLLSVWWHKVNWLVAYPFSGMGEALPRSFTSTTLAYLRSLPVGSTVSFDEFATELIRKTGLTWSSADSQFAAMALKGSINRMVIGILAGFGAIECESEEKGEGSRCVVTLVAFQVTPLGSALLEATQISAG
jgi:hypothetical protein